MLPAGLKFVLFVGIAISQYLCGLATVTSVSRMIFAFARDGGLPASASLRKVSPTFRTPVAAIWTGAILAVIFTVYTPVYTTVVSVTVIFLFISYGLPIALGAIAYGRTWTQMGPWTLGGAYRLVALLCVLSVILIFVIGVQPPNDKALWITLGFLVVTALVWFGMERRRFKGPPIGDIDPPAPGRDRGRRAGGGRDRRRRRRRGRARPDADRLDHGAPRPGAPFSCRRAEAGLNHLSRTIRPPLDGGGFRGNAG